LLRSNRSIQPKACTKRVAYKIQLQTISSWSQEWKQSIQTEILWILNLCRIWVYIKIQLGLMMGPPTFPNSTCISTQQLIIPSNQISINSESLCKTQTEQKIILICLVKPKAISCLHKKIWISLISIGAEEVPDIKMLKAWTWLNPNGTNKQDTAL